MSENPITRFVNWLREGYTDADACAITYVLKQELHDSDRKAIARAIAKAGDTFDEETIVKTVEKFEFQKPTEEDIVRIRELLKEMDLRFKQ